MRFAFLILLVLSISCKDFVEEKCNGACDFFVQCLEKEKKEELKQFSKKQISIQCVQGCTMLQGDVIRCFEEANESCEAFGKCLLQAKDLEE